MNSGFQFELSAVEIFVLAAFLGFDTVFSTDEQQIVDCDGELKRKVKSTVRTLERKKLIRYDLDGTLYITEKLKKCIECMCEPKTVGVFFSNLRTGRNKTTYVLKKYENIALVEKTKSGRYRLGAGDNTAVSKLFPKSLMSVDFQDTTEKMLYEDAEHIKWQLHSFNKTQATSLMKKYVSCEDSVPCICEILSGESKFLNVHILTCSGKIYKMVFSCLVTISHNRAVCVSVDENDVVNFYGASPAHLCELVELHLGINKGDVV